jgi:hypothetical protein
MRGSVSNRSYSLFIAFSILTLAFSLISAGIFNANTTVGMIAYAKKSKKPSEENSNDGGGGESSDKSGDSSGGSDSKDKKNNDQGTNDNEQQLGPPKTDEEQVGSWLEKSY